MLQRRRHRELGRTSTCSGLFQILGGDDASRLTVVVFGQQFHDAIQAFSNHIEYWVTGRPQFPLRIRGLQPGHAKPSSALHAL
ncbi:hypothetical protein ACVBEG_27025 [Pseudomonas sp. GG8]